MRANLSCAHGERICVNCLRDVRRAITALKDAANKATLHVPHSNRIPADQRAEIVRLAYDGVTQRAIARKLSVSGVAVARYFPRDAKCKCGALLTEHPGYCSVRFAKADERREAKRASRKYRRSGDVV